ncbi:MAG TPA: hypothetical protein VGS21_01135, partial [Acidimicrobiales bacterium]|nr:hypothetical protein [Acidimicrobiales bacterium]
RQKMTARRAGIITGLVCAAQYGISSELLAEAAVVGVVAVVLLAIARPREAMRRFPYVARSLVWAGIVSAPFVGYPIWMALDGPGHIVGAAQPVLALEAFRGDLLSAVVPTVTERFSLGHLGAVSSSWVSGNLMENTAYLGVPLIVALVAIVVRYRKDKGLVLLGALLVASYVATLGYSLDVGGKATGVPMPLWIGFHLPLLDSVVSTRYFVFGYMFAAMILALGMQRLHEAGTGRGRTVAVVVLAVVVLLPIVPRFPMGRLPSTPSAVNASYPVPTFFSSQSDLAPVPSGSVALVYPISLGEWPNYSVLWQSVAGFRFKLPDADSYMPGNDGSATARPPTLRPVLLQDLMQEAYFGSPRGRDPFVDPSSPATVAGIRRAMTRYTFDTVVVAPDGSDPSEFMKAVTLALGAPPDRVDGVFVWYDVPADLARLGTPATG